MAAIGFLVGWLPLRILGWIICGFMREPPSLIDSPSTAEIIYELSRRLKPEETPEQKDRRRIETQAGWGPSGWGPLTWIYLAAWGVLLLGWLINHVPHY
jgi:hypothetical protein